MTKYYNEKNVTNSLKIGQEHTQSIYKEELKQLIRFLMNETNWDIQKSALRASVSTGYAFFNGYKLYNIVKNV